MKGQSRRTLKALCSCGLVISVLGGPVGPATVIAAVSHQPGVSSQAAPVLVAGGGMTLAQAPAGLAAMQAMPALHDGGWGQQGELTTDAGAADNLAAVVTVQSLPTTNVAGSSWSQQGLLKAGLGSGDFAAAAALSADGNTVLVGADAETVGKNSGQGAAYVFTRTGDTWSRQSELTAGDGAAKDGFGFAVALSAGGTIALVGADNKQVGKHSGQGAAYVFTRPSSTSSAWSRQSELTAADGAAKDGFGLTVALSADGATALVSSYPADYVFTRLGSAWHQQSELPQSGSAVALSADGATALVGGSSTDSGYTAVDVFTRLGSTWHQQSELPESGPAVALSADATAALVGASTDDDSGSPGFARVLTRSSGARSDWTDLSGWTGADGDGEFGISVALSADGTTAMIGDPQSSTDTGAAFLFNRPSTTSSSWGLQAALTASNRAANDSFGSSVALSGDGATALVADPKQGAAYVFAAAVTTPAPAAAPPAYAAVQPQAVFTQGMSCGAGDLIVPDTETLNGTHAYPHVCIETGGVLQTEGSLTLVAQSISIAQGATISASAIQTTDLIGADGNYASGGSVTADHTLPHAGVPGADGTISDLTDAGTSDACDEEQAHSCGGAGGGVIALVARRILVAGTLAADGGAGEAGVDGGGVIAPNGDVTPAGDLSLTHI